MLAFLVQRISQAVLVMFVISVIAFAIQDGLGDPLQQSIQNGIHNLPVRVYYEDTDFSGVVYHANYLRFAERGRSEFLHACGIHHSDLFSRPDPLAFTVVNMNIDFLAPAKIDDRLAVSIYFH